MITNRPSHASDRPTNRPMTTDFSNHPPKDLLTRIRSQVFECSPCTTPPDQVIEARLA